MSTASMLRALSWPSAVWRAEGREAVKTTARWQDKRAHIVRRLGGCFSWVFSRASHIATLARNVRRKPNALHVLDLSHIASRRHGR